MSNLSAVEKQVKRDADSRRANDKADARAEEREYQASLNSMPLCDRIENMVERGKGGRFLNWIYDTFFGAECNMPSHKRSSYIKRQVDNQKLALAESVRNLAIKYDTTAENIVISYFRMLGEYVELKRMGSTADQGYILNLKRQLDELFAGMLIAPLLELGIPYWIERDWIACTRVKSEAQYHYEIERRKNTPNHNFGEAPKIGYNCTSFLREAGFKED